MEYLSKLPERLRELMSEKELLSETLASATGLAGSAIRSWLRGERLPTLKGIVTLANFFLCPIDYIAGRTEKYEEISPRPLPPFYSRLRKIMEAEGFSRYNIVHHTSIADSYFSHWARGESPALTSLCILADYMSVSLDYLLGRTDY